MASSTGERRAPDLVGGEALCRRVFLRRVSAHLEQFWLDADGWRGADRCSRCLPSLLVAVAPGLGPVWLDGSASVPVGAAAPGSEERELLLLLHGGVELHDHPRLHGRRLCGTLHGHSTGRLLRGWPTAVPRGASDSLASNRAWPKR